jgi:hypothetical protein
LVDSGIQIGKGGALIDSHVVVDESDYVLGDPAERTISGVQYVGDECFAK